MQTAKGPRLNDACTIYRQAISSEKPRMASRSISHRKMRTTPRHMLSSATTSVVRSYIRNHKYDRRLNCKCCTHQQQPGRGGSNISAAPASIDLDIESLKKHSWCDNRPPLRGIVRRSKETKSRWANSPGQKHKRLSV